MKLYFVIASLILPSAYAAQNAPLKSGPDGIPIVETTSDIQDFDQGYAAQMFIKEETKEEPKKAKKPVKK